MTIGNIGAVIQTDLRRILSYSSIAQAGYILAGFAILSNAGTSASIFYLICYLFMNFGAWIALEIFINKTGKTTLSDINGLGYSNTPLALGFTFCLLSLAGIPLTAGFWGKFYLFSSILFAGHLFIALFVFALLNTVVGIYYYTRIIKSMFVKPINKVYLKKNILGQSVYLNAALVFCVLFVMAIGFFSSPFIAISQRTVMNMSNPDNTMKNLNYFYRK